MELATEATAFLSQVLGKSVAEQAAASEEDEDLMARYKALQTAAS